MASRLLETKLYAPRPRPGVVPRPRLSELLDRGARSRLTLVSAPPGFGKSTLVADWLAGESSRGRLSGWVSLDPGDNDAASFWTYVLAAFETAAPGVASEARPLLKSGRASDRFRPDDAAQRPGGVPDHVLLVLDDYHVIDRPAIHDGMAFLLDHLPPRST